MKDTYEILVNPDNFIFKYEIWVKGTIQDTIHGTTLDFPMCRKIGQYRTAQKAQDKVDYYLAYQYFKGEE